MLHHNRKAYFDFQIQEKHVAGIVLKGTEIKSVRSGKISFTDSFCHFIKEELFVKNLYIAIYDPGTYNNHNPLEERKLLLNKKELRKLESKIREKGYSILPLSLFINEKGLAKLEIGLGKGKKNYDKRESIKEREAKRQMKKST